MVNKNAGQMRPSKKEEMGCNRPRGGRGCKNPEQCRRVAKGRPASPPRANQRNIDPCPFAQAQEPSPERRRIIRCISPLIMNKTLTTNNTHTHSQQWQNDQWSHMALSSAQKNDCCEGIFKSDKRHSCMSTTNTQNATSHSPSYHHIVKTNRTCFIADQKQTACQLACLPTSSSETHGSSDLLPNSAASSAF